jgi:hypothetical protein
VLGQPLTEEEREAVARDRRLRVQEWLSDQPLLFRIQAARGKALRQALPDILTVEQCRRLWQVELQLVGLAAFTDPEVEKLLALDDDQKARIQALAREPHLGEPGSLMVEVAFQTRKVPRVLQLLREDQKEAWKRLRGRPLEVRWPAEMTLAHSYGEMQRAYSAHLPARTTLLTVEKPPGTRGDTLLQPGRP